MRGGNSHGPPRDPCFHKQGREPQGLSHGGAGPLLAQKGIPRLRRPKVEGNALV